MKFRQFSASLLTASTALLLLGQTAQANDRVNNCQLLMPVGGNSPVVSKTVSQPSIPLFGPIGLNNDWNTDFAVNSGVNTQKYQVTLTPRSSGEYSIRMYLKYSDGTADNFYDQKPTLQPNQPLIVEGIPRRQSQPYQVNVFVGDLPSLGKSYQVSVEACP
ncbi:MAG: hypothetical protein VKK07_08500 [Merismopediaceae bacterium]|nr:hypothetical protein [Merismopediaceae bacterium]